MGKKIVRVCSLATLERKGGNDFVSLSMAEGRRKAKNTPLYAIYNRCENRAVYLDHSK